MSLVLAAGTAGWEGGCGIREEGGATDGTSEGATAGGAMSDTSAGVTMSGIVGRPEALSAAFRDVTLAPRARVSITWVSVSTRQEARPCG
jgi:hypothetical protein